MIAALLFALQSAVAAPTAPVVTARLLTDTVGVGQAVTVELRVRAPAGAEVRFPEVPDSSDQVEPLDPRLVRDASTASFLDRTAVYRLIAWDTGARTLRFDDITIARDGREERYRVSLPALVVRSVLPQDSAARQPRAPRELMRIPWWWWRFAVGGVVLLLMAWALWRSWRRRHSADADPAPDAGVIAAGRFAHADALGLIEAGEAGRHVLAHLDVMREYLATRFPSAERSLTARELVDALAGAEFPILPERVRDLLLRSEPIAFARAPVSADLARELSTEARAIVRDVETAHRARRPEPTRDRKWRRR